MNRFEKPLFGVAGFPPAFFESSLRKKRLNIFEWLSSLSLDWVELQNTYGVKMKESQAREYRALAEQFGIGVSLHAPYYITLASGDHEVVRRSIERIFQCFELADTIGAKRIVFHPGHFPGTSYEDRRNGLKRLVNELLSIKHDVPEGIFLYAETAGKKSQIGSLEEIVEICEAVPFVMPCLDMAHIHGFQGGTQKSAESIIEAVDYVAHTLGRRTLEEVHFHMYPVEVNKNGEKRHRAFHEVSEVGQATFFDQEADRLYYPRPEHFISAIKELNIAPVVVCEALNSQEQGAQLMKNLFFDRKEDAL